MMRSVIACLVLVPALALADKPAKAPAAAPAPPPDLASLIPPEGDPSGAAFAFAGRKAFVNASSTDMTMELPGQHVVKNVVGSFSKDKRAFWASGELVSGVVGTKATVDGHASALWERSDKGWKLVAFSLVPTATGKQQQAAIKSKLAPPAIQTNDGAKGVYFLTIFPDVFREHAIDKVSARKDAVLLGSGASERYVGGGKFVGALGAWKLAFTVRDGIASGTTQGRLLWIATNLDTRPLDHPDAAPVPYRVFLIFEGDSDGNYEMVHASFAAVTDQAWN
jgi:hypothetical protein